MGKREADCRMYDPSGGSEGGLWLGLVEGRLGVETTELGGKVVPTPNGPLCRGQPADHLSAVALRDDTGIGDDHDSPIGARPDQAAKALFEPERGVREHVLAKCVSAPGLDRLAV